jgi:hypothetical protein
MPLWNEETTMKRTYTKPSIHAEEMTLDTAISASDCNVSSADLNALQRWGFFAGGLEGLICTTFVETLPMGEDTVCVHSNVRTVLRS